MMGYRCIVIVICHATKQQSWRVLLLLLQSESRMTDRVPCITRTRGGAGGYYITSVQRLLTVEEMLNLQGLPLSYRAVARREGVSDRQLGMMVGNAIATNVLRAILPRMLTKIGKQ